MDPMGYRFGFCNHSKWQPEFQHLAPRTDFGVGSASYAQQKAVAAKIRSVGEKP